MQRRDLKAERIVNRRVNTERGTPAAVHCARWDGYFLDASQRGVYEREPGSDDE